MIHNHGQKYKSFIIVTEHSNSSISLICSRTRLKNAIRIGLVTKIKGYIDMVLIITVRIATRSDESNRFRITRNVKVSTVNCIQMIAMKSLLILTSIIEFME